MRAALRTWIAANPRAPTSWRDLALRLAEYHDSAELWSLLEPLDAAPLHVMAIARDALARTDAEVSRPSESDESAAFGRVERRLAALRDAIERAPLPDGLSLGHAITAPGLPDVQIGISWRPWSAAFPAYQVSLIELLDGAASMLASHRAGLVPRAVARHRDRPAASAFIRWADWLMRRAFGEAPPAALAHLANAALDLADDPLAPADVRAILKDAPPAFAAPT